MEKEIIVNPYGIVQLCDSCKDGEMVPTGRIKTENSSIFEHKCNVCGTIKFYPEKFPAIRFRRSV